MDKNKIEQKILELLNNLEKAKISNKIKAQVISDEVFRLLPHENSFYFDGTSFPFPAGADNEN